MLTCKNTDRNPENTLESDAKEKRNVKSDANAYKSI
jgi:hypothetical protein